MAATSRPAPSPDDRPPDPRSPLSFRDAVSRPIVPIQECTALKNRSTFRGEPALLFSQEEYSRLADPFDMTLVGKFTTTRPNMEFLRKGIQMIGFKGDVSLGLLDTHHVLLRFSMHENFYHCWSRGCWAFKKHVMRVLKWTPDFTVDHEPPVCPVWISFHHLPIHLFQKGPLLSLASIIGHPLRVDTATKALSRPSVARVCIELNLLKSLPKRIWIGAGETGFWQAVEYEDLPAYFSNCSRFGHEEGKCAEAANNPDLPNPVRLKPQPQKKWVPKDRPHTDGSAGPSGVQIPDKAAIPTDISATATLMSKEDNLNTNPSVQSNSAQQVTTNAAHTHENSVDAAPPSLPIVNVLPDYELSSDEDAGFLITEGVSGEAAQPIALPRISSLPIITDDQNKGVIEEEPDGFQSQPELNDQADLNEDDFRPVNNSKSRQKWNFGEFAMVTRSQASLNDFPNV